jgi:DNA-binding MarR family transcriptional regulator
MKNPDGNISEVIAPMMAITMELDAIIGTLLREKFAMSLADFKILRAIHMLGACSQLDIARFNHVTEAAISKRISALSDDGLIEKQSDSADKRKSILSLTKQGKTLMKKLQGAVIANTESMLVDFSRTNRKLTTELLLEILGMIIRHSPRKEMLMESKHPVLDRLKSCNVNDN